MRIFFAAIFIADITPSSHDEILSGNRTAKKYSKNKNWKTGKQENRKQKTKYVKKQMALSVRVKSYVECTDMIPALLHE